MPDGAEWKLHQLSDWKTEKHVPVIECRDEVSANAMFDVAVTIGKEISHPNTTEHHIRWISLYYKPDNDKFSYELGRFEFNSHGESVEGPNTGPAYTHHSVVAKVRLKKSGTIVSASFCNIHGLWEYSKRITVKPA